MQQQNSRNVPEVLSKVGTDNSGLAKISLLTCVVHPAEHLGEAAAKMLLGNKSLSRDVPGIYGTTTLFP